MNISNTILNRIESDHIFRLTLAIRLGLSERQVQNLVASHRKGTSVRLRDAFAVEYFKECGYTTEQIFEKENHLEHGK